MSFLHCLYIGHFEHDGDRVRFGSTSDDPILKPVVRCPLDREAIERVADPSDVNGQAFSPLSDEGGLGLENGHLVADRYGLSPEAIDLIHRLVQATGCEVVDFNARSAIRPEELTPTKRTATAPAAG